MALDSGVLLGDARQLAGHRDSNEGRNDGSKRFSAKLTFQRGTRRKVWGRAGGRM